MALTEKGIAILQKWIAEFGSRQTAKKMIDQILTKRIGMSSEDLSDTATFADGLDDIESLLDEGDFDAAFSCAKDTALMMLDDEGFGMGLDENKKPINKKLITERNRMKELAGIIIENKYFDVESIGLNPNGALQNKKVKLKFASGVEVEIENTKYRSGTIEGQYVPNSAKNINNINDILKNFQSPLVVFQFSQAIVPYAKVLNGYMTAKNINAVNIVQQGDILNAVEIDGKPVPIKEPNDNQQPAQQQVQNQQAQPQQSAQPQQQNQQQK